MKTFLGFVFGVGALVANFLTAFRISFVAHYGDPFQVEFDFADPILPFLCQLQSGCLDFLFIRRLLGAKQLAFNEIIKTCLIFWVLYNFT